MNTRNRVMTLRSKTTVSPAGKSEKYTENPKKASMSTESRDLHPRSSSNPRKRAGNISSSTKSIRRRSSESIGSSTTKRKKTDFDGDYEKNSESGYSDIQSSDIIFGTYLDQDGMKFQVNGYIFRRDCNSPNGSLGLRCVRNSSTRPDRCRMRAVAFPADYKGQKKIPKLQLKKDQVAVIITSNSDNHNHTAPSPKKGVIPRIQKKEIKRKKPAARKVKSPVQHESSEDSETDYERKQEREESKESDDNSEEIDEPPPPKEKIPTPTPVVNQTRGVRRSKVQASKAWEWLAKPRSQYPEDPEPPARKRQKPAPRAKPKVAPKTPPSSPPGKRSLSLTQKLRKNAVNRFTSPKRARSSIGGWSPKKSKSPVAQLIQEHYAENSPASTPSTTFYEDASGDECEYIHRVNVYDNTCYVMNGYSYTKVKDRKSGGIILRCVDRLNCKARAVAIYKTSEIGFAKCLYGRLIGKHTHDRAAPGHGIENEDSFTSRRESSVSNSEHSYANQSRTTIGSNLIGISKSVDDHQHYRDSFLPPTFDYIQMFTNYCHCRRTLIDLQDGAHVADHLGLVRLKEATGEQLVEYLTAEDMDCGDEDAGIDRKTVALFRQQFKQCRALYDLFVLSVDDFNRFLESYKRWLTPETAQLWWNTEEMMEFICRRILRTEKFRDRYISILIKCQGSSQLRFIDRPVLPLPEPKFVRCSSSSIQHPDMRENLHGIKTMIETLESSEDDQSVTITKLMDEFDEAATSFMTFWAQENAKQSEPVLEDDVEQAPIPRRKGTGRPRLQKVSRSLFLQRKAIVRTKAVAPKPLPNGASASGKGNRKNGSEIEACVVDKFTFSPTIAALRGILFRYNYCISRIQKLQADSGYTIPAERIVRDQLYNEHAPRPDAKSIAYYWSLKKFRAVCDLLAIAPAHVTNFLTFFEKWRVHSEKKSLWKSSFVFELFCRYVLRSKPYKKRYKTALRQVKTQTNISTMKRPPVLPFLARAVFLSGKSVSAHKKRMRSLALNRVLVNLKQKHKDGRYRAQEYLKEIDYAVQNFFSYLTANNAWPPKNLDFYLSSDNNAEPKDDDDLFVCMDKESSVLDSLCTKRAAVSEANKVNQSKAKGLDQGPVKTGRPRNGKITKNGKRALDINERASSPSRLLCHMKQTVQRIEQNLTAVNDLMVLHNKDEALNIRIDNKGRVVQLGNTSLEDVGPHGRRIVTILNDLNYMQVVMTLGQLANAAEDVAFDHVQLGRVVIENGRIVSCQNPGPNEAMLNRRVTMDAVDLPHCIPFDNLDWDNERRTLSLRGIPIDMKLNLK